MKIKDFYFKKAKYEGYPARSIYKLQEIDKKYNIIRNGMKIIDLGAAPGSWSLYILSKFKIFAGCLFSVDIKKINMENVFRKYKQYIGRNLFFLQKNLYSLEVNDFFPVNKVDLIISDIAPSTTSSKDLTHQLSMDIFVQTLKFIDLFLNKKGNFLFKVFEGESLNSILKEKIKTRFEKYRIFKPKSCRKGSREIYIIGFSKN